MKKLVFSIALFIMPACGAFEGLTTVPDAGLVDTGGTDQEGDCTQWGRISTCPDGTIGCDRMVCLSHDPNACQGPWGCHD